MFVIWGKKVVYRRMGYVADLCPMCHTPAPFELRRVGLASHVYYISVGEGQLVGYERRCQACGTPIQAVPTIYASFSDQLLPLAELAGRTFPNMGQVLRDRLVLEERISHSPSSLSPQERHALIRNPFLLLSPKVEKRFESTHIDKEVGLSLVGAIILLIVAPTLGRAVGVNEPESVVLLALCVGIAVVVWQGLGSRKRFMRREVLPALAKALRPLQPTMQELTSVLV